MSIKPQNMVNYARQMLKNNSSELELRNVINRAYYGAFLTARDAANITDSSGSIHKKVADHYSIYNSHLSNNLFALKKLRVKADYKPNSDVTNHDAQNSCRMAQSILNDLDVEK